MTALLLRYGDITLSSLPNGRKTPSSFTPTLIDYSEIVMMLDFRRCVLQITYVCHL